MEAKHTPTPWFVGEANCHDNFNSYIGVRSLDDWVVCEVQTDVSALPGEANADFIVRAVNCHDQLIAVLKKLEVAANTAQHCYDFSPKNFAFAMSDLAEAAEEVRAALALAEEKP